ncbi:MAG: nucleotide exchange factor GrpE [Candidatus Binataceae bacterium]|jgi:molecular chaperone GrpE
MAGKPSNSESEHPIVAEAEQEVEPAEADAELIPSSEVDKLNAAIQEKDREIADLKDKYLRVLADSENTRKRIRQQSEESVRIQKEALLRELLTIVDNLERAVEAARGGGNGKPIVEGVELVLRTMHDFLRNQGVTQVSAIGQPFDPLRHEAVSQVESSTHQPNTVVEEFNRGYQIGDRTLRPARVTVAKAAVSGGDEEANN